jgi:RNA-directed DNA polymerase
MIKAPTILQELRRKIYVKAKTETQWKFWGLYVHICKHETLQEAYRLAKRNKGAPGIDGVTFDDIEATGVEHYLHEIHMDLVKREYKPSSAREVKIPKPDGKSMRILKIPTIRDRIVEGAMKLILEPIFEADFQDGSYGYRPKRKAADAIKRVSKAIISGKSRVIDFDLSSYFDTVRHDILLRKIANRIQDNEVLHLIKLILKAGGKRGLRQGGVLSPVFSNLFLNDVDSMLERAKEVTKTNGRYNIEYARWADDLVIVIDGFRKHTKLQQAVVKRLREEIAKLGLTINEDKSKITDITNFDNSFNFLGFEFRSMITTSGKIGLRLTPKKKAKINLQLKLKTIFKRKRGRPITEIVTEINPILRGWVNYFRIGNSSRCFKNVEDWVQKKMRRHLYKACQRTGFGWKRWSKAELYRNTGIFNDYKIRYAS